jgi:hypothetical protein
MRIGDRPCTGRNGFIRWSWLALAGMAAFLAQKSHTALLSACNIMIL